LGQKVGRETFEDVGGFGQTGICVSPVFRIKTGGKQVGGMSSFCGDIRIVT
jgi:hypothetical protein